MKPSVGHPQAAPRRDRLAYLAKRPQAAIDALTAIAPTFNLPKFCE